MKQYATRDIMALDNAGEYYSRHVLAMTQEQLHEKCDIAAELAWRDCQIDGLKRELTRAECDAAPAVMLAAANKKIERLRDAAKAVFQIWGDNRPAWEQLCKAIAET